MNPALDTPDIGPFLVRAMTEPRYAASTTACLRSASVITTALKLLDDFNLDLYWWVWHFALGAVLVFHGTIPMYLCRVCSKVVLTACVTAVDLYHHAQLGTSTLELVLKANQMSPLRAFFERAAVAEHDRVRFVSRQAIGLIDRLVATIFPKGLEAPPVAAGTLLPLIMLYKNVSRSLQSVNADESTPIHLAAFPPPLDLAVQYQNLFPFGTDMQTDRNLYAEYDGAGFINLSGEDFDAQASMHALLAVTASSGFAEAGIPTDATDVLSDWTQVHMPPLLQVHVIKINLIRIHHSVHSCRH